MADGKDGASASLRGAYTVGNSYAKHDIVGYAGSAYIAQFDNPTGLPGHDESGWMEWSARSAKGLKGERGPRRNKGEKGDNNSGDVTIQSWLINRARYSASPLLSNGQVGATLELRKLFELFQAQTSE